MVSPGRNCAKETYSLWSYDFDARKVLLHDDFSASLKMEEYAKEAYETTLACTPRLAEDSEKEARRREISWLNIRWFMMTLLNRMDRTSMYSGLEARSAICRSPLCNTSTTSLGR